MKSGSKHRRRMRRLRTLIAITATTLMVAVALLVMRSADHRADPWRRGPASVLASRGVGNAPCRDLFEYICRAPGQSGFRKERDPTGEVQRDLQGQNAAEHIKEQVQALHPGWSALQVDQAVAAEIFNPTRRSRLENAFEVAKRSIEQILLRQPNTVLSRRNKTQLVARIRAVNLLLPPPVSIYEDDPGMLYRTDAVYERLKDGRLRVRVGGAYVLTARSWFNHIFTLAHEIAHSIDPCEVEQAEITPRAYPVIKHCLIRTGLVALGEERLECQKKDQLSETFADWLATQVTADSLSQFSTEFSGPPLVDALINSVKDLCEQDGATANVDFHPSPQTRINGIFGRNAQIRTILECSPEPRQERECQWLESL